MLIPTPIETDRLRLRAFRADGSDVEALHAVLGDAESMRYYPAPFDRDGATGEVIGDCGPTVQEADGEPYVELGWHVLASRQRRGIATEAGRACRDAAFAVLDVPFLISLIRPENVPSRRVAEKLGFDVWRGTIRAGWGHLVYRLDRPS